MNNSFNLKRYTLLCWSFFILTWISLCVDGLALDRSDFKINPDPPASTFASEDSLSTFRVPDGYRLELVAAEPMIDEPVCMAWGPNGELYVAEMRTYMRDIDMSGELEPVSRVVKLVDLGAKIYTFFGFGAAKVVGIYYAP